MNNKFPEFKNIFFGILFIISIMFVGRYIHKTWPLITGIELGINFWWLPIVTFLFVIQHLLYVLLWRKLLIHLKTDFSYPELLKLHFSTLLMKYIPGKIWFPLARGYYIKNKGVSTQRAAFIILIELFLGLFSALLIVIFCFLVYRLCNAFMTICYFSFFGILGSIYLFGEKNKNSSENRKVKDSRSFFIKTLFRFLPFYLFLAILDGVIFYMFLNLFVPIQIEEITVFIGINSISKLIFSVIPNQVGVGEMVLLLLLKPFLVAPYFVLIPLSLRIWKLIIELALLLAIWFTFLNRNATIFKVLSKKLT